MPTYEYICKNCGERFEKAQSFSARPLKTHDVCGGDLQKVFHASGVVFKGSGFYATDNRAARASSDSSTESTSATSNGSGDKQPEKKSDAPKKDTPTKKESSAAAAAD